MTKPYPERTSALYVPAGAITCPSPARGSPGRGAQQKIACCVCRCTPVPASLADPEEQPPCRFPQYHGAIIPRTDAGLSLQPPAATTARLPDGSPCTAAHTSRRESPRHPSSSMHGGGAGELCRVRHAAGARPGLPARLRSASGAAAHAIPLRPARGGQPPHVHSINAGRGRPLEAEGPLHYRTMATACTAQHTG